MFSVLIPGYNHYCFLVDAVLSSLKSPLVIEVLVVDDGSTDRSRELFPILRALDPRVRILDEDTPSNWGAHARLNQLAESASGEWLSILNSDDFFASGRFEAISRIVTAGKVDVIFGDLVIVDGEGERHGLRNAIRHNEIAWPTAWDPAEIAARGEWLKLLAVQNIAASTTNLVFTKEIFARVGGFHNYRYCHDWDFALRCAAVGRLHYSPLMISMYRSHFTNTIKEARRAVEMEVCQMFRNILTDYPELRQDRGFVEGVQFNPYIRPAPRRPLVIVMPPSDSLDDLAQATSGEHLLDVHFVERLDDVPLGVRYIYAPVGSSRPLLSPNELRNLVLAIAVRPYAAFLISRTPEPYPLVGNSSIADLAVWRTDAAANWTEGNVRVLRSYTTAVDPIPVGELVDLANATIDFASIDSPITDEWKPAVAVAHNALGISGNMLPVVFILPAFLALGGVERLMIDTMTHLSGKFRFVIITTEALRPDQGTLHREAATHAHVYDLAEIARVDDRLKALQFLNEWYSPVLVWICNGSLWQINNSVAIREMFSDIPIVDNQAYDHEQGWIQYYNYPGVRSADRFVAINRRIQQTMLTRYSIPADRIDVIYHGFNPSRTREQDTPADAKRELQTRFGLHPTLPVYGMVGRLSAQKRPLDLVRLAERLQSISYPAQFVWVGCGELESDFTALVKQLTLNNITLIPAQQNVQPVFAMLSGLIITSEFEGLPVVMLEALSLGVPVLSTDVGAIGEVLERFGSGVTFGPAGNIDILEHAFHRFVASLETFRSHAVQSATAIAEDFSSARMAREYGRCFEKALVEARVAHQRRFNLQPCGNY
jgi:glycosyltransferase involved in cell wall biosynthesis